MMKVKIILFLIFLMPLGLLSGSDIFFTPEFFKAEVKKYGLKKGIDYKSIDWQARVYERKIYATYSPKTDFISSNKIVVDINTFVKAFMKDNKSGFIYYPRKKLYSSSSSKSYRVKNIGDKKLATVWSEGKKNYGRGEWIKFRFKKGEYFEPYRLIIFPGHGKSRDLFKKNNRLKSAILQMYTPQSNEFRRKHLEFTRLHFQDKFKYHVYSIGDLCWNGEEEVEFKIYIEDVYKGSKYNDTCIAEIAVLGDYNDLPIEQWGKQKKVNVNKK